MRKHCFKLIREVFKQMGWKYKGWIFASVLISSVSLLPPRLLQYFSENALKMNEIDASQFLKMLVLFGCGIAVALWVSIFVGGVLNEWFRLTISVGLKRDAVIGLGQTRIDALDSAQRGDWLTRMTGDLYNAEEFLTDSLPEQLRNLTHLIGIAVMFFILSGPVVLLPLLGAIFLGWFNIVVQRKMAPVLSSVRQIEGGIFQSMIETFEGLRTIRSYGAEGFTNGRIGSQLKSLFDAGMRIIKSMAGLMGMNQLASQIIVTAVLTLVAYRIRGGELTAEEALTYPFYLSMFLGAAGMLVASAYDWNRFFIEGGRLASLLYDDSIKETHRTKAFGDFETKVSQVDKMKASDLVIAYGDSPPTIDHFDFELKTGEMVAIMGPSGCGKSTFVESFSGLRRANGGSFEITLKDGNQETFPQAPTFISAFVEQQPYLFVGSIRDNITLGMDGVDDDDVWKSLEEVGLSEIVKYRGGLDAVLSDRGRNLSVGQQYRLALCRALVCGRPFLFMDEPFAALDEESVELVIKALHEERANGAGVILITHLLPVNLDADRVVEMEPVQRSENPGGPDPAGFPAE